MNRTIQTIFVTLTVALFSVLHAEDISHVNSNIINVTSDASYINIGFELNSVELNANNSQDRITDSYFVPNEGTTYEYGMPLLPAVSRFVVVPPEAGLNFTSRVENQTRIQTGNRPTLCMDEGLVNGEESPINEIERLYPPSVAVMSRPMVIRGVRLVKVTTYPIQYDPETNEYIHNQNIQTEITYTDAEPVNPARIPIRRNRSPQFLKFIRGFAVNGDIVGRDDPDRDQEPEYVGHYLVVTHENCLEYAGEFIEWRRKAGYKVDILSLTSGQANNYGTVRNAIIDRYEAYLDEGIDPFDYILLIGDITRYDNINVNGTWILNASTGNTIWGSGAPHADYLYACMEGNNDYNPDVGISRWASGTADQMGLAVGRTMAYEAEPYMNNTDWFERVGVYSQHWGNNDNSAWHITIHTNARWGEEVAKSLGFDDVNFYERYQWDQHGAVLGPWVANLYNDGVNLLLGRAENYYWRTNFNNVNDNRVFPIRIVTSGHGEWAAWCMWRAHSNGGPNHLRGPVATTFGWGGPPTIAMSAVWMEMVNGILMRDLPLGWGYTAALNAFEMYIPEFNWMGQPLYRHVRTDVNCYGDPGIQPWIGVPRVVEAEYTETITAENRLIEAYVTEDDEQVAGAQVTLYIPGDLPDFDDDDYVDYDEQYMRISHTDEEGMAYFVIGEGYQPAGDVAYVTVTGRDIRPFFGEVDIRNNLESINIDDYTLTEVDGNGDEFINPGESFNLELVAKNLSSRNDIMGVTAQVTTDSPWIEIDEHEIAFGDIDAQDSVEGDEAVTFYVSPACPDGVSRPITCPMLEVTFRSGQAGFRSAIQLEPHAPNIAVKQVLGGERIPADRHVLNLEISNIGSINAPAVTGQIQTLGMGVSVVIESAGFPAINAGRYARVEGDPFLVAGNRIVVPGSMNPMMIVLTSQGGFVDTAYFELQVEEPTENAPQGPDGFGYICFDDTDEEWDMAPTYDWIEICPEEDPDYDGEECDFTGNSEHNIGESQVVELGFETQFYGRVYDRITIGTNGFIAMGSQPRVTNFQNWPMDRAMGGGVGMIAPLWDDLRLVEDAQVYYYYDEDEGRFIVEWYKLRHRTGGNRDLTFQVILYDRDIWITETNDQNILVQYQRVTNVIGGNVQDKNIPYASVGISSPDGTTGINYSFRNEYPITSAPLQDRRALLFATSPRFRSGILYGRVTDAETDDPIENVMVFTEHGFTANTDENGNWRIQDALAEVPFDITAMLQGYNDSTLSDLFLEEDDSLEINFNLLHPEFRTSDNELGAQLNVDDTRELDFELFNDGNGPLTWRVERQLRGDAEADPWELRRSYHVGLDVEDDRIGGVVFIDDYFYVSGGGGDPNLVYVFDRDGNLQRTFEQFGEAIYGMVDLAWDGELIWGTGERTVFGFTPEGELVKNWNGMYNPNTNIAWDSQDSLLWISGTVTNEIIGFNRDGHQTASLDRMGFRTYGLAYWPDDPDGYNLYIFNSPSGGIQMVHKMNTLTNDTMFVSQLEPEDGGRPSAAFISNQVDYYSWVFIDIANTGRDAGGDRIDIWQLDARRDWFRIEPTTGVLNPGESTDFSLTLDATDLPTVLFEGDLHYFHNAIGGENVIPVTLEVLGGRRNLEIELESGWNLISANVIPDDQDIIAIFQPLVDADALQMVKDVDGNFYRPDLNFNNIPRWEPDQAYQVSVSEDATLEVLGDIIPENTAIDLEESWNMIAYYPRLPIDAITALQGIAESLIIAKDGDGNFYLPEFNYNGIGNLREGQGYLLKMIEPAQLTYTLDEDMVAARPNRRLSLAHFSPVKVGADNMSVLVLGDRSMEGWEVSAITSTGIHAGSGVFDIDGKCGLAVWGDDPTTETIDGALPAEELHFRIWNGVSEFQVDLDPLTGDSKWLSDGYFIAKPLIDGEVPVAFGIQRAFPNPANGPVRILYGLENAGLIRLTVYDLNGREVASLASETANAGHHQAVWNTDAVSSGVYVVRLQAGVNSSVLKVAVVK